MPLTKQQFEQEVDEARLYVQLAKQQELTDESLHILDEIDVDLVEIKEYNMLSDQEKLKQRIENGKKWLHENFDKDNPNFDKYEKLYRNLCDEYRQKYGSLVQDEITETKPEQLKLGVDNGSGIV